MTAASEGLARRPGREYLVDVQFADGRDSRSFHVGGGFVVERTASILELAPPIPSRDWDSKDGQTVTFRFSERPAPTVKARPAPITTPAAEPDSLIELLAAQSTAGAAGTQMLIVIFVYLMTLRAAPATPWGIMMAATVLILSPWVPFIFGFGDPIAAGIVLINVVCGGYAWKMLGQRTADA